MKQPETRFGRLVAWASLMLAFGASLVLALMMYVIFADVILRYFFNAPIKGSVEIIYCLMGLLVSMGFGLVTLEDGHVKVDIVTSVLPLGLQRLFNLVVNVLATITVCVMTWRLAIMVIDQTRQMNVTQVLELPVWLIGIVMAACTIMLVLTMLLHLGKSFAVAFGQSGRGV